MCVRGHGIATGYWGEEPFPCGWLSTGDLVSVDPDAYWGENLAAYKCPARIAFLPSLPKGATGNVQRRALKERRPLEPALTN